MRTDKILNIVDELGLHSCKISSTCNCILTISSALINAMPDVYTKKLANQFDDKIVTLIDYVHLLCEGIDKATKELDELRNKGEGREPFDGCFSASVKG